MDGRETPRRLVDHGLTERELEVLNLVVDGLRDQEIADRLGIALGTVRNHLTGARGKLGARSRVDVAVRALRSGIVALKPLEAAERDDA
jgi:DNA-binding CsgD family transcriptional regulator